MRKAFNTQPSDHAYYTHSTDHDSMLQCAAANFIVTQAKGHLEVPQRRRLNTVRSPRIMKSSVLLPCLQLQQGGRGLQLQLYPLKEDVSGSRMSWRSLSFFFSLFPSHFHTICIQCQKCWVFAHKIFENRFNTTSGDCAAVSMKTK